MRPLVPWVSVLLRWRASALMRWAASALLPRVWALALLLQQRRPIPSRVQAEALRLYLIAHRLRPEQYERHPQMHLN